jgi:hypothetical protein
MNLLTKTYRRFRSHMTAQQAANLNTLANFMDGPVPRGRLNMNLWQSADFSPTDCGTRACALGWACTIPSLRAQGLAMREVYSFRSGNRHMEPVLPHAPTTSDTCAVLFGVQFDDYIRLFWQNGPSSGRAWDDPKDVAVAVREVMIRSGYEPTPDTDADDFLRRLKGLAPIAADAPARARAVNEVR